MANSIVELRNIKDIDPYGIVLSTVNWSLEETMQIQERIIFDLHNKYDFPEGQLEELMYRIRRKLKQLSIEPLG